MLEIITHSSQEGWQAWRIVCGRLRQSPLQPPPGLIYSSAVLTSLS